MPTYTYKCRVCEDITEVKQKISEESLTICTKCGNESLYKIIQPATFMLMGKGWHGTSHVAPKKRKWSNDN